MQTKLTIVKLVDWNTGKFSYSVTIVHDGQGLTSISVIDERVVGFLVALAGAGEIPVEESRQVIR